MTHDGVLNMRLPASTIEALKAEAGRRRKPVGAIARLALDSWLSDEASKDVNAPPVSQGALMALGEWVAQQSQAPIAKKIGSVGQGSSAHQHCQVQNKS